MAASAAQENPFVAFAERYFDDIPGFAREVLGIEMDEWQAIVAGWVAAGERAISIRSGHGVGKSTCLAIIAVHALCTRAPVKIVMTAPSQPQLFDALFAETRAMVEKLPAALRELIETKAERIVHRGAPDEVFISARTSRAENPEALQGVHSEWVYLFADEASGVPDAVFEAAAGSMSGHRAVTILTGNPTRTSGFFYDTHTKLAHRWKTLRVSCVDSARVSREYVEEMKERYGEDSNAYRVRVLGEFPRRDDDTMIPLELVEAASERDITLDALWRPLWGLDIARFGSDSSALVERRSKIVSPPKIWRNIDLMQLCGAIKHEYDAAKDKPLAILTDVIGLGAGVVDRLGELGLPVRGINVSEAPSLGGNYAALRDELWAQGKAWLEARDCRLPQDERLKYELTVPRYSFTSAGKLKVESKAEMKKRGIRSPDVADAFMLTFAEDATVAAGGTAYRTDWKRPLKRNLRGII